MKLTLDQIRSITLGAERVTEENGAVRFYRFTEEEEKAYIHRPNMHLKTFSSAGVQMEFLTDADAIGLKLSVSKGSGRSFFAVDVFVGGEMIGCIKNFDDDIANTGYPSQKFPLGYFEGEFLLGSGEKSVRIVFPWSVVPEIREMTIRNSTYVKPIKKEKVCLMYGDSITHGYDALHPSNAYSVKLAYSLGAEPIIKAIGGEKFFPELASKKSSKAPDFITVAYGSNDWSGLERAVAESGCERFFYNLETNYPDVKIFAITPIWRKDMTLNKDFGKFFEVAEMISDICLKHKNITVINGFDFVPKDERYFSDLRLHPNDKGFEYYAENLKKEILKSF